MSTRSNSTQYSQYVFSEISRVGHQNPGVRFNIHQLAECLGLKVTPSFRKRVKQAVLGGLLHDVEPHRKENPKMSEYRFPVVQGEELPF